MAGKRGSTPNLALPLAEWPSNDRTAWEQARGPRSRLFGGGGAAHHLREATATAYVNAVGQFLGHLHRAGLLNAEEAPADRFQVERLNGFVEELGARGVQASSIKQTLVMLRSAMRFIAPEADLTFLTWPSGTPLSKALPSEPKSFSVQNRRVAMGFAETMNAKAMDIADSPARRRQLRDAALIGVLISVAPRLSSMMRMRFDRLVRRDDGTWLLKLKAEDTKNHTPLELPLGARCTKLMDDYLADGRGGFPGAAGTDHVWMGMKGPMTVQGISRSFKEFCLTCFGKAEGPQAARRWLRSEAVRVSPELALDAALTLGHSQEVSAQYYAEATSLHAALRHGEGVRAMRAGKTPQRRSDRRQILRQPSTGQRRRGKG